MSPFSVVQPVAAAVNDCGFTGAVATFTGAVSNSWGVAGNWDTSPSAVPYFGQICIPVGKTALVDTDISLMSVYGGSVLKVQGTLRVTANVRTASTYDQTVENSGRIEVAALGALEVGNYQSLLNNLTGGVVRVESGGTLRVVSQFANMGGQIDLTGGGSFVVNAQAGGYFEQGKSADATPVQSTIVGGNVTLVGGVTRFTGSGAGTFVVGSGANAYIEGTLRSTQTVQVVCGATASDANLFTNATLRNEGTIDFTPRIGGSTCQSNWTFQNNPTVTNVGMIRVGSAAQPTNTYGWVGTTGTLVNAAGGTIQINASLYTNFSTISNDAAIDVDAGASFVLGDTQFELRDGTLANNGQVLLTRSSPTYGFFATFRVLEGNATGNPVILNPAYVEFLGNGAASAIVREGEGGGLRNQSGPIVIHENQHLIVNGDINAYGLPVENRGTITMGGRPQYGATFSAGTLSNRGTIVVTSDVPTAGTGGYNTVIAPITNEPGGVLQVLPSSRGCSFRGITNNGLIDLQQSCVNSGELMLGVSSVLRVASSAAGLAALVDVRGNSLGGTLEVVTDTGSPPLVGAPRDLILGRAPNGPINGSFAKIVGAAVSTSTGYSLSYPSGPRRARLAVIATTQLIVSGVSAAVSANVGDDTAVTWTTNVAAATSTPWVENVYLSNGPSVDASSVLIGQVSRSGAVAAGSNLAGSVQVRIPAVAVGPKYIVVVVDADLSLPMNDRTVTLGAKPVQIGASAITVGGGAVAVTVGNDGARVVGAATAPLEGTRLLRLVGSPSSDLVVTIATSASVLAFAAAGRLPTDTDHDAVAVNGNMIVSRGDGSTERYVLLRNTSGAPVTVNVTAVAPGLSIAASTPTAVLAGSPAQTAVAVTGTGFTAASVVRLTCGATVVNAQSTQVDGPTHLTSLFALPAALGSCTVSVGAAVSPSTLTVTAPSVAVDTRTLEPTIEIVAPSLVRSEVDNPIVVRWTNRTGYSLPAPLVTIAVDSGTLHYPDAAGLGSSRVEVLAIGPDGPAGILAPGATGSVTLSLRTTSVAAHAVVHYTYAFIDRAAAYDFGDALAAGLTDDVTTGAKNWVRANGPAMLGVPKSTTAGVLEAHLASVATYLSGLGQRINNPGRLINFDLARISADDRLDAFISGDFGVGQIGLPLPRLVKEASTGDVLVTDGTRRLRFASLPNGTYSNPPGDGDVLTIVSGNFVLTARDGSRRQFSPTGVFQSSATPDGRVTTFTYSGTRLVSIASPTGTVAYTYDGSGRITKITDPNGGTLTYTYDANGRQTSANLHGSIHTMTWGADGLPASATRPDGVVVSTTRDAFGRPVTTSVNGVVNSTNTYNGDGSISRTDALGNTIRTWMDADGSVAKSVDALGRITTLRRDASGAAVGVLADGVLISDTILTDAARNKSGVIDGNGGTITAVYDLDGTLASRTDQDGRTTTIARDAALRPVAITDPAGKTSTIGYDSAGRPSLSVDRTGKSVAYAYNVLDQVETSNYAGYGIVTSTYDAHRNLVRASGPTGATTFTYDSGDRLTGVTYPSGLGLTYSYDAAGRRISTTTSDGQVTGATYDSRGRLATVTSGGATLARYEYDAVDRLSAIGYANGMRVETTRDVLGRVTRQRTTCCTTDGASAGGTVIADVQMTYDARDRVATRIDAAGTTTYTYDGGGRLTGATTVGAGARTLAYTYDGNGNRLTVNDSVAGNIATVNDAVGRPSSVGGQGVSYDAEGRQIAKGTTAYSWDARGQMSSAVVGGQTTTYTYDALGTPITRTTAGVTTNLLIDPTSGGWLLAEYDGTGTRQAGYAWGQGIAARLNGTGTPTAFYATDARGDVLALANGSGTVTDTYRYLPFGEVAARTGSTVQPLGYQGAWGLRTEPTGLIDVRSRAYDPTSGRFVSEDPQLFAAANPATYAGNDPVNRVDITGGDDGWWDQMTQDPVGNGAALLGLNTDNGIDSLNFAQSVGLVDTVNSAANMVGTVLDNRAITDLAQTYRGRAAALAGGAASDGNFFRNSWKAKQYRDAAQTLLGTSKVALPGQGGGLGGVSKFGAALNGAQALKNIYDKWGDDPVDNGALVVRQTATAVLKTLSGTILPGSDLVWDPLFNVIDEGSRNWIFENIYGGDESKLYNESGWKPPNRYPRPGGQSDNGRANDPNAITGPAGALVGSTRFVSVAESLPYRIDFENKASATLPANEVVITHTLDADLDLATFELGSVGFGGRRWAAPAGVRSWTTLLDDRDRSGLYVRLKARLDPISRIVTWTFTGLDPATMAKPADTTRGFLPKNSISPQGEGDVGYAVHALASTTTGTAIVAQASIVFDGNPAIATNIDTVVVDAVAPTSAPTVSSSTVNPVSVAIGAADDTGGSGVGLVDVWASKNGGDYALVADAVSSSAVPFAGEVGATYRFVTVPTDVSGNRGSFSNPSGPVEVVAATPPTTPPAPLAPSFVPLVPARLLESRSGAGLSTVDGLFLGSGVSGVGSVTELQVAGRGGVPVDAAAVVLNVTVLDARGPGYVSVYPCGSEPPNASSLNFVEGSVVPNAVIVKVGVGGKVCLFTSNSTGLLADVNGFFPAVG